MSTWRESILFCERQEPKLCQCGCGTPAAVATKTNKKDGYVKGQPTRFARGHWFIDRTGQRFGQLTLIKRVPKPDNVLKGTYWLCRCDCGNEKAVLAGNLTGGEIISCGCYNSRNCHKPETMQCGYVRIHDASAKPRRRRRLEHVVIAERAIGRPLPEAAEVHHVNGIRNDNRNRNLVICENHAYHSLLHARQTAYAATGNPESRKCQICQQWDSPSNGLVRSTGPNKVGKFFHRLCVRQRQNVYAATYREKRRALA